jgi:hypothetical protein
MGIPKWVPAWLERCSAHVFAVLIKDASMSRNDSACYTGALCHSDCHVGCSQVANMLGPPRRT